MEPTHDTSWTIIEAAAEGDADARERFAALYAPALQAYFRKRWQHDPVLASVDDAVQEVFVDCFKPAGVLDRVDCTRDGGFRAFFYGVARTTARSFERAHGKNRARNLNDAFDADALATDDDEDLTRVFDREWARSIVQESAVLYRHRAEAIGGREMLRVEILRLRFECGLPIREIAAQLDLTPKLAHKEHALARKSYQRILEEVVAAHYASDETQVAEKCREVLRLLS